jgi:hypothetical protein
MKIMLSKALVFAVIVLFIGASIVPSINAEIEKINNGKEIKGNRFNISNIETTSVNGETEYWGVCVVAFDDPYSESLKPCIYNSLLAAGNWEQTHIKLLYRENATKAAILDALDWLIENADENDIVLFSDNSHGTRRNGKYGIVPVDSEETGIITTDELDEKFDAVKAKELCLIFDCCLAGNLVDKRSMGINRIDKVRNFNKIFTTGVEGGNRVVLMSTMKYGLGFHMTIADNETGELTQASFYKFMGDAFTYNIDYNNDGFCSAEEAFSYAKEKWRPYAMMVFLMLSQQIQLFLGTGFFCIPFPTIYDGVNGELPIVHI